MLNKRTILIKIEECEKEIQEIETGLMEARAQGLDIPDLIMIPQIKLDQLKQDRECYVKQAKAWGLI